MYAKAVMFPHLAKYITVKIAMMHTIRQFGGWQKRINLLHMHKHKLETVQVNLDYCYMCYYERLQQLPKTLATATTTAITTLNNNRYSKYLIKDPNGI